MMPLLRTSEARFQLLPMNIPNSLTILRILLIPVYIGCMTYGAYGLALLALLLAGITDGIDGLLARRWNQQTRLGMFLDPLADKLLLTSGFISLGALHLIPLWVVILVVSRDVILLLGTAVTHLISIPIDVTPTIWGKGTTLFQLSYVFLVVFLTWLDVDLAMLIPLLVVMVGFTLTSGFHYLHRGYRSTNALLPPN